jgi:hypothetical protein
MIDFETRLGAMLDDVAASVQPHPDPDSIFTQTVTVVPNKTHHFRPRYLAVAAASIVFVGTSAFAMEKINSDPPTKLVPTASPVSEPTFEPTTTSVQAPATIAPTTDTTLPHESPNRPSKDTGLVAPLVTEPTVPPTEPTVAPAEPTVPPVSIEFVAKLGADGRANNPMTQGFFGKANPGSQIHLTSSYGEADTTADGDGKWAATLTMREVPPGTKVAVRITSNTSDRVREFSLLRPGGDAAAPTTAAPTVVEFVAYLGANGSAGTPMTQGFFGSAQPGSAIHVGSDWGVADTTATAGGYWETTLSMGDVPPGTTIAVRITSTTSTRVREFTLQRPGTPVPASVDFTAHAGWTTTDATPPFCEYSGTSTAGAVITITSPYGNAQAVSNGDGHWSARVEFPTSPVAETFNVHIASSKGTAVYDFPLTHV